MKKPILFKEYIWLLNTIRRAGKISFEELNEKWLDTDMSEGMPLTKATFGRHRIAIEDIFGIIIECQRQGGYLYYISNPNALHDDRIQNWMLSTLSVSNVISESAGLKDRILLEPVADDNGYLQMVIDAMKKNVRIAIVYNRYGGYNPRNLNFEPYALKMWHQRWYVLGFSESFGVVQGDEFPTERIVLRAYDMERFYIQDLPLHHSQRLVSKCEDYADFELYLRPTADFCAQILSRGKYLKVIKPQWLADEIREKHKECLD